MDSYKGLKMQLDDMQKKRLIFSELFFLQNKIQTKFDRILGDITSKQFIILVIAQAFSYPPSLTEVAKHAGCSRQNVKKVTAVLEKKGFLTLVPDKDSRAVRIVLEQKYFDFYELFLQRSESGLETMFAGMNADDINQLFSSLHQVEENINKLME